jgi:hypothetical protein
MVYGRYNELVMGVLLWFNRNSHHWGGHPVGFIHYGELHYGERYTYTSKVAWRSRETTMNHCV